MIGRIKGTLLSRSDNRLLIDVNGVGYEVAVPQLVARWAQSLPIGHTVELITLSLLQLEPGRATPLLIGFRSELEREFFERLLSVPKLGVRGALLLFSLPVPQLAKAIEENDLKTLIRLPGVGRQRARELIASLQGRVTKFALIPTEEKEEALPADLTQEALQVLLSLGYSRSEANNLLEQALSRATDIKSVEDLIRLVYQVKKESEGGRGWQREKDG
ncbi:MAG: Holliday junction branch migration protein RuvA [Armatimonadetes bacterium]|nr:Holliday junction branch migration protein RuvA [Armatimonadota bacterium]MDW8121647.1 Holliday junction branch migration protein RuvA [Armatimonadota bacterium]